MNWDKGKNRLIILFFCINMLLGWANYRKETTAYVLKDTQVQDIKAVLETHNIFVDAQIPQRYKPIQKLAVSPFQINSSIRDDFVARLLQTLDGISISIEPAKSADDKPRRTYKKGDETVIFEGENILYYHEGKAGDMSDIDIDIAHKEAERWMAQMQYSARKMHRQVVEGHDGLYIIYYDKYNKIPIFDSYIKIKITSLGISEVEIHKVELGELIGEKQEIYSADQMIFNLIQLIATDEPTHIKDIVIGYALENPKGTHLIAEKALPFYQIILEDGRVYYINSYNSEIREKS